MDNQTVNTAECNDRRTSRWPWWWSLRPNFKHQNPRTLKHYLSNLQGEKDDKVIAVCADDPEFRHYTDIKQLPPHRLKEIQRFFEDYKKNENKQVAVNDFLGAEEAVKAVKHSM